MSEQPQNQESERDTSQARRVARNTSFLTISQIISYGESFIYVILVARYLGPQGLGVLNFAIALIAVFSVFANFGLTTITTREVARDPSKASKYAANVIPIQLLFALLTIGLIAVFVNALGYSQQTIYVVYVLSVGIIVSTFSSIFLAIFQAFERLEFQAIVWVIISVIQLCGAVIAIQLHLHVVAFALLSLLMGVVALAYVYAICVRRFFVPGLEADFTFWKSTLTEAWPMAAMAISVMIYFRIDAVIISVIQGTTAVGFYSIAYNLSEASTVVSSMFIASIFPILSRLHETSKTSFEDMCAQSIRYMLYLAVPMAFFVTLWAKPIVPLLFGVAYVPSVAALQILIWAAAIMYVTMVLGAACVAANLQRMNMKLTFVGVAVNIGLNVLLIPKYSYIGASFATVATEAFGLALVLVVLGRGYGYDFGFRRTSLPPLLGLLVIVAISVLLFLRNVPLALITVINLAVYAVIIYKLGINEQDKRLILSLLKPRRPAESER
jgi:O-antigen/teichoic acid export membrane protein